MAAPTDYRTSVAVPLPDDDAIRRVLGDRYDPSSTLNVTKMFAGTEDMFPAMYTMVQTMFGTEDIDDRHREMIILRAAKVLGSPYEWQANAQMAANAGLTQDEIDAAAAEDPVRGIDPELVLLCTATEQLSSSGTLTNGRDVEPVLERFGDVLTRRYIAMIGWFNMLSLFLNGCRVPLETTDKIGDQTSPLR